MVIRAALILLLSVIPLQLRAATTLAGTDGVQLTLDAPARRIVSLAPDLTELVYAAGAGGTLIGTSAYSDYPQAARHLPQIGDAFGFDTERIVALEPDLILAWDGGTPVPVIERLRALHMKVLVVGAADLTDIARNLELIGQATGHEQAADSAAQAFLARLQTLRDEYSKRPPVRVLYEISATPLYTVGGNQIISRVLDLCGGRNIFSDLKPLAAAVNLETVLARDPQAIVTGDTPGAAERLKLWQRWPQLNAVTTGSLFRISGDLLDRSTPRMLSGAAQLCKDLQLTRERLLALQ
jgi:iron complex transport system substrate-binding protein